MRNNSHKMYSQQKSPKPGNSSQIKFNRRADPVTTKPKKRSMSGTLLDFVKNQRGSQLNQEEQELMQTGIIIKTPDDKKKSDQRHSMG